MASSNEILHLCRLCLIKENVNVSIFENGQIREKINTCLPVKVSQEDKLPKKICDGCFVKLDVVYDFYNASLNAEKQLLKWLGTKSDTGAASDISANSNVQSSIVKQEVQADIEEDDSKNFFDEEFNDIDQDEKEEEEEEETRQPPAKRAKRTAAVKAAIAMDRAEDDDEDEDDPGEPTTKMEDESDDSDAGGDHDNSMPEAPSTSAEDQPGPSGVLGQLHCKVDMVPASTLAKRKKLKYSCEICGERWRGKQCYTNHMRIYHRDLNPFACGKCDKKFKSSGGLNQHMKVIHENVGNEYKCDLCGAVCKRESCFKLHKKSHVEELLKFKCEVCHKGFLNRSALKQHMLYHEKTVCPVCGKTLVDIKSHLRIHSEKYNQKNVKCTKCDSKFSTQYRLKRHILIVHDENAPKFVCDICGKQVTSKMSLDKHVLTIHKGIKRYKCTHCDKSFGAIGTLNDHILTHTGERPHKCTFCDKCFTQRTPLMVHMRLHTGERPYECNICHKDFISLGAMRSHKKTNHGTS